MSKSRRSLSGDRLGFTMIELMISASLIAVLSLAIFSTFARGLDVWKRVKTLDRVEDHVHVALEKFSRELRTTFNFKPVKFTGEKNRIVFPTYVRLKGSADPNLEHVGKVTYLFNPEKRAIFRRQEGYSDLFHSERVPVEKFIAPVEEAVFAYYAFNPGEEKYEWREKWKEPLRPEGVRLTITVLGPDGKQKHIVKTVFFR